MKRKYIILVGDGMGDYPLDELNGKTPLEAARTPNMDRLAAIGRMGTTRTIPDGMEPGSDVANMSLLGYDPARYHTGRAPLEAASMGVRLAPDDVAFRCNLVTLKTDEAGVLRMHDYSSGHIPTELSRRIVADLQAAVKGTPLKLYPGVSYRHLLVWSGGKAALKTTPPHDVTGQPALQYAEVYRQEPVLQAFFDRAAEILADHPLNRERAAQGKSPATNAWLWGQGHAPSMPTLKERYGIEGGAIVSAVDLLKGIGVYAGLDPVEVPGATGYLDTNYEGKVAASLAALDKGQFVYVHIEAPDETSHEGSLEKKLQAIEAFDENVVGPVIRGAAAHPDVRVLVLPDHLTPIRVKTHVSDPIPFLLVDDLGAAAPKTAGAPAAFNEKNCAATGWTVESAVRLFDLFIRGDAARE